MKAIKTKDLAIVIEFNDTGFVIQFNEPTETGLVYTTALHSVALPKDLMKKKFKDANFVKHLIQFLIT